MTGQSFLPFLLLIALIAAFVGVALFVAGIERKRREAINAVATRLGLSFSADRDRDLARQYQDLRGLHEGENRYAFDILTGNHLGQRVTAFDFHHETSSTDSEGKRSTSHHYRHLVLLHFDRDFPNLFLAPESFFSKIAQAFGYDDIDFESHEFSKRFCVRSADRKYAYDFCNAMMIDFLLGHPNLHLETRGPVLASIFNGKMDPALIESELNLIGAVRRKMPEYLFSTP